MSNPTYDIAVIGGGIVGAATAYKLQHHFPDLTVLLLEKEDLLANHQTGNNSGVIHSGIYYKPGSYKARNCVEGRRELVRFAQEHKVAHDVCGKVVVATDESELPHLDKIYQRGIENGVEGVERITPEQIREIEPECTGIAGMRVACTGIIDFRGATEKMAELVPGIQEKSTIKLGHEVLSFQKEGETHTIRTNKGDFNAKRLIFCGGLQADRLAQKDDVKLDMRIVGFRGDYYELTEQGMHKVKHLIYPVPNPKFPFLGVHFTRMIFGGVECGPNAVFYLQARRVWQNRFQLARYAGGTGLWRYVETVFQALAIWPG